MPYDHAFVMRGLFMDKRYGNLLKIDRFGRVLDPQGKAIEGALKSLGIAGVSSVRQGKVFDIELASKDKKAAETFDTDKDDLKREVDTLKQELKEIKDSKPSQP